MAQYKIGNRYLSEEEYESHCEVNWMLALFVIGAVMAVLYAGSAVPEEWPKYFRFLVAGAAAIFSGSVLSFFAGYIRKALWFSTMLGVLSGVGYCLWVAV